MKLCDSVVLALWALSGSKGAEALRATGSSHAESHVEGAEGFGCATSPFSPPAGCLSYCRHSDARFKCVVEAKNDADLDGKLQDHVNFPSERRCNKASMRSGWKQLLKTTSQGKTYCKYTPKEIKCMDHIIKQVPDKCTNTSSQKTCCCSVSEHQLLNNVACLPESADVVRHINPNTKKEENYYKGQTQTFENKEKPCAGHGEKGMPYQPSVDSAITTKGCCLFAEHVSWVTHHKTKTLGGSGGHMGSSGSHSLSHKRDFLKCMEWETFSRCEEGTLEYFSSPGIESGNFVKGSECPEGYQSTLKLGDDRMESCKCA